MRVSTLFISSVACLTGSEALAQVYDTGDATSASWSHTISCAGSCTERGRVTMGPGYSPPRAFIAGWQCDWRGSREERMAVFGIGVRETNYDPVTGLLEYELTTTMRKDATLPQEFECTVRLGAIGGFANTVYPYIATNACSGSGSCAGDNTYVGIAPLTMEHAGVVLRDFQVETRSGAGIPVDAIGVVTSATRTGADVEVDYECLLTDGSGASMSCTAEWMSVATGPGYTWGTADDASVDWSDLYHGATNPYAYSPLQGVACGQAGWYLDFHGGAAPLAGLASGYADCGFVDATMDTLWTSWLGDTYGTTATSTFYGRHLGTALFLY